MSRAYTLGPRVYQAVETRPYERQLGAPLYRPLQIFTLDPSTSRFMGGEDTVKVPYENLEQGSHIFTIETQDAERGLRYEAVDFDDPLLLLTSGRKPSPHDPLFHQQMVYAVSSLVYDSFRKALGRDPSWGFKLKGGAACTRLGLRPYAGTMQNAYYDKEQGAVAFGYYRAEAKVSGRNLPSGVIFTSLSHDIIAHEVTHALLDGMRAQFTVPSCKDVLAFHEAFADLVAIFQHFKHDSLLRGAIERSKGNIRQEGILKDLAQQFGATTGAGRALRSALAEIKDGNVQQDQEASSEPHTLGSVLVSAVFEAFLTIYQKKIKPYRRLATGGSDMLPEGELNRDLLDILTDEAAKLARQFLNICIRAIDYCPPVDLHFGEYLRAVITADYNLVPDDPLGYREAWIDAFQLHGIYPERVGSLAEDALLWQPPEGEPLVIAALNLGELDFDGDPARPAGYAELTRQATLLGDAITQSQHLAKFGLKPPDESFDRPAIESIRTLRRVGPDGQVEFDLVAEVTQERIVRRGDVRMSFYGGSTIILDARGRVRYAISKNVANEARLEHQEAFMTSEGRRYWKLVDNAYVPARQLFRLLHHVELEGAS